MRPDWNFLTKPIANENDALDYIRELIDKNLDYHLDDDVFDILWTDYHPTTEELVLMDKRQNELFDIDGFDPHELLVDMYALSEYSGNRVIGTGLNLYQNGEKILGLTYKVDSFHVAPRYYREDNPLEGQIMVHVSINITVNEMLKGHVMYEIMMDLSLIHI